MDASVMGPILIIVLAVVPSAIAYAVASRYVGRSR